MSQKRVRAEKPQDAQNGVTVTPCDLVGLYKRKMGSVAFTVSRVFLCWGEGAKANCNGCDNETIAASMAAVSRRQHERSPAKW